MRALEERFWSRVNIAGADECWEWRSTKQTYGYGILKIKGKMKGAHRLAWLFTNGEIPNGLWVLHKCDNPSCVNPNHLFLGTARDNAQDRARKGRNGNQNGEQGNNSKLINEQVLEIHTKYRTTSITQRELATQYEISQSQINNIVRGKEWRHLLDHE